MTLMSCVQRVPFGNCISTVCGPGGRSMERTESVVMPTNTRSMKRELPPGFVDNSMRPVVR
jgi:hypothetical protein